MPKTNLLIFVPSLIVQADSYDLNLKYRALVHDTLSLSPPHNSLLPLSPSRHFLQVLLPILLNLPFLTSFFVLPLPPHTNSHLSLLISSLLPFSPLLSSMCFTFLHFFLSLTHPSSLLPFSPQHASSSLLHLPPRPSFSFSLLPLLLVYLPPFTTPFLPSLSPPPPSPLSVSETLRLQS